MAVFCRPPRRTARIATAARLRQRGSPAKTRSVAPALRCPRSARRRPAGSEGKIFSLPRHPIRRLLCRCRPSPTHRVSVIPAGLTLIAISVHILKISHRCIPPPFSCCLVEFRTRRGCAAALRAGVCSIGFVVDCLAKVCGVSREKLVLELGRNLREGRFGAGPAPSKTTHVNACRAALNSAAVKTSTSCVRVCDA